MELSWSQGGPPSVPVNWLHVEAVFGLFCDLVTTPRTSLHEYPQGYGPYRNKRATTREETWGNCKSSGSADHHPG